MKQKTITFITGFLFYGLFFGTIMYFTEAHKFFSEAINYGIFFGISMALFEVFLQPLIKVFFEKIKNKQKP